MAWRLLEPHDHLPPSRDQLERVCRQKWNESGRNSDLSSSTHRDFKRRSVRPKVVSFQRPPGSGRDDVARLRPELLAAESSNAGLDELEVRRGR